MAQYINKDALVAEIERKLNSYHPTEITSGRYALIGLLDFINTLEVKEVDLNKELSYEDYKSFFEKHPDLSDDWGLEESWTFAQYFFELGLKAKQTS